MIPIHCIGPAGSNSHEAALKFIAMSDDKPENYQIRFTTSNTETMIETGKIYTPSFGVVPIHNSTTQGLVVDTLEVWLDAFESPTLRNLTVVREVGLPVRHNMCVSVGWMEKYGPAEFTRLTVLSHSQALAQCRKSLKKIGIENIRDGGSTSLSAKVVSSADPDEHLAVVCSDLAADTYGLIITHYNIQDKEGNATKFHLVRSVSGAYSALHRPALMPIPRSGASYRTAMIFEVPNEPGALVDVLHCIRASGVNMSSVKDLPTGDLGRSYFYVEMEESVSSDKGRAIMTRINTLTSRQAFVLGSYPKEEK